jgi:ABC-type spermidine/putrescine transport system permease subunit II
VARWHYKILTLLPLDAICITTNCVVTGVCFAIFVQKRGNRGTALCDAIEVAPYSNDNVNVAIAHVATTSWCCHIGLVATLVMRCNRGAPYSNQTLDVTIAHVATTS